ncbi:MAG TPA: hypothetical protein VFR35_14560 [Actinoplanes sp.]|nr:hypothetical protein [Actinoplanes sp.]
MVAGAAIAAALALPGCAPAGYNAADYGGGSAVDPAADAVQASPTAEPSAGAAELDEDAITSELTGTTVKRMGKVVVDQEGYVLYRFDKDKTGPEVESACDGDCAKIWPPALTEDGKPELDGVDPADVGSVTRADGTTQLTIGKWPVYRYAGDEKPGQWRGQNVSGSWFVVNPDGTRNLTCLPRVSKPIAPPDGAQDSGGGAADYSY